MTLRSASQQTWARRRAREQSAQQLRQVPSRWAGGSQAAVPTRIFIGRNNVIFDSDNVSGWVGAQVQHLGLAVPSSAISSVPSADPADITTTYADGLCCGRLDDVSSTKVWLSNHATDGTTTIQGVRQPIYQDRLIYSLATIDVPIAGGGGSTAPVYIVSLIAQDNA